MQQAIITNSNAWPWALAMMEVQGASHSLNTARIKKKLYDMFLNTPKEIAVKQ